MGVEEINFSKPSTHNLKTYIAKSGFLFIHFPLVKSGKFIG